MPPWRPQPFRSQALASGRSEAVVENAIETAAALHTKQGNLPPVFSLRHLAYLANADYATLREVVARDEIDPYRTFRIRKRPARNGEVRYRVIAVPKPALLKVQRWIVKNILVNIKPHAASVAFSKGDKIFDAASPHCQCTWLIKLDVLNFFESINEIAAYRVFRAFGYQALIAFEMARLSTRLGGRSRFRSTAHWYARYWTWPKIAAYRVYRPDNGPTVGHLPQGAPTSPMLANLAMRDLDDRIQAIAKKMNMIYTRYADDLSISTKYQDFTRDDATRVIREVFSAMRGYGLAPNLAKTRVVAPGGRKVVLGLIVNGSKPHLPREFKLSLRQHIHYLTKDGVGPVEHARRRGFSSVVGFRNHLQGLLAFAKQIDPDHAKACEMALADVDWPL